MKSDEPIVPVSVVIPTVGRIEQLRRCLDSLVCCQPRAGEVVVSDQSRGPDVQRLTELYVGLGIRVMRCTGRGTGRAANVGLAAATYDSVVITHDDCTVERSWVGAASRLLAEDPEAIFTGQVFPAGDPLMVPSTKVDPAVRDHTGEVSCSLLYPNNMAVKRSRLIEFGGFDERIMHAEDNDLCYRWLRAGRTLRYEPSLVVWHHEWRVAADLCDLYARYWWWQGAFYGKHLRRGDFAMLRFLGHDLHGGLRALIAAVIYRRPRWLDSRREIGRALVPGLMWGWRDFPEERGAETPR